MVLLMPLRIERKYLDTGIIRRYKYIKTWYYILIINITNWSGITNQSYLVSIMINRSLLNLLGT